MSSTSFLFRKAIIRDTGDIHKLYKIVSKLPGGLARDESEISKSLIEQFTLKAQKNSTQYVALDPSNENRIIGEIHCYKPEPKVFNHILSDLIIVVHPDYQGQKVGKRLFETLLSNITSSRADVLRVELIVRESNVGAVKLYESLGFVKEGRFEKRIRTGDKLEADIPMAWFNPKYRRS